MRILSIDTSCDETACAVTNGTKVSSNIVWSQASAHAKFGGVMPSLAQRMHQERIDWVVNRAITNSKLQIRDLDAIAVTVGPGLSIALGVGVNKAKELAALYKKPLIPINHIEAHLLSPLAQSNKPSNKSANDLINFPAYGLCVSGKNTEFVLIERIGKYKILAESVDDAIGEAFDKAARMLGLGYPGGYLLEKFSKLGDSTKFTLPIPLVGQEKRQIFSYSGLKTSLFRKVEELKSNSGSLSKQDIYDLAAAFQDVAFKHIERVFSYYLSNNQLPNAKHLLLGGGVSANIELRKRLRKLGAKFGLSLHIPYTKKLCGDNAAMIGVCAYLNNKDITTQELSVKYGDFERIDRDPRLKIVQSAV